MPSTALPSSPASSPPSLALRLWPGIALVLLQWALRFLLPAVNPDLLPVGIIASLVCGLAILIWWAFFSRAPRVERWGGLALLLGTLAVVYLLLDKSIATGMMGLMFPIYAIPVVSLALVAWAILTQRMPARRRRLALVATLVLSTGVFLLLRTNGVTGDSRHDWAWRWSPTAEERLLQGDSQPHDESIPHSPTTAHVATTATMWPGFRGMHRDGVVHGSHLQTDWAAQPPEQLWRRPIGPGWSSFAIQDGVVYTQEQRGEDELVSAYDLATGQPIWQHADRARFWESQGGAGPRATPTLHANHVYSLGATGIVNALDAGTGTVLWSRNAAEDMAAGDMAAEVPDWGFSSSPLIVDGLVVIDAGGLIAYDLDTGQPAWRGDKIAVTYSSPHLANLDGVEQVLLLNSAGLLSVSLQGDELWRHEWQGFSMTQPAFPDTNSIVIGAGQGVGTRRLSVTRNDTEWKLETEWDSIRLKPYFNDLVLHEGHAYGFDGGILAAMDVSDGSRAWKGGRYGHGQLILLADQDLLLVLTEKGDLALVAANPDQFSELARVPALEGKTWNHPVLVGDVLLVRNAEEMAAFRIAATR